MTWEGCGRKQSLPAFAFGDCMRQNTSETHQLVSGAGFEPGISQI